MLGQTHAVVRFVAFHCGEAWQRPRPSAPAPGGRHSTLVRVAQYRPQIVRVEWGWLGIGQVVVVPACARTRGLAEDSGIPAL